MKTPGDSGKFALLLLLIFIQHCLSCLLAVLVVGKANSNYVADELTSHIVFNTRFK